MLEWEYPKDSHTIAIAFDKSFYGGTVMLYDVILGEGMRSISPYLIRLRSTGAYQGIVSLEEARKIATDDYEKIKIVRGVKQ